MRIRGGLPILRNGRIEGACGVGGRRQMSKTKNAFAPELRASHGNARAPLAVRGRRASRRKSDWKIDGRHFWRAAHGLVPRGGARRAAELNGGRLGCLWETPIDD